MTRLRDCLLAAGLLSLVACEPAQAPAPAPIPTPAPAPAPDPTPIERARETTPFARFASDDAIKEALGKLTQDPRTSGVLGLIGTGMGGGGTGQGYGAGAGGGFAARGQISITNNQEAGVDEGDIVKQRGDHLVVLRRGRLFTIAVGGDALAPVAAVDVGAKGHHAWYDELLIHDDLVIVIGFSYQLRATELVTFTIDADGRLERGDVLYLRSNDYYSARNYTSRLVGDELVFYMPYTLRDWSDRNRPSTCKKGQEKCDAWTPVLDAGDVVAPLAGLSGTTLHTVVTCSLRGEVACRGRGILGPYSRSFYVSQDAIYVWVHDPRWTPPPPWSPKAALPSDSVVYRLDLKSPEISALRTYCAPIDQFSFQQSADGHLNVLVSTQGGGDAMWAAEGGGSTDVALLRVPLAAFPKDAIAEVSAGAYTDLPDTTGYAYALHNRFVGDHLLYGVGNGWGPPGDTPTEVVVVDVSSANGVTARATKLEHPVDRIEPMGARAVVVGASGEDLHFTAIDLAGGGTPGAHYVQEGASQGELRSHGFFFQPTSETDGLVGLPIREGERAGAAHLRETSAQVLFLAATADRFTSLGTLAARRGKRPNDRCQVSCVDWYGNSRPIFLGDRVIALLGYELVEGALQDGALAELRRADMLTAL